MDSHRRHLLASLSLVTAATTWSPPALAVDLRQLRQPSYNPKIPYSSVRSYKTLILYNNLRVLLVSDARASRSMAALTVDGAGQFAQYADVPGCAHLLEHMILSYDSRSRLKVSQDFEEWLSDREGTSNGFTAYTTVCFHFNCPQRFFVEGLERFATLFVQEDVEKVCRNPETLKREVRRVDSELDYDEQAAYYLSKAFVNPEHPYSRFSAGDLATLERYPVEAGIDVGERLIDFFRSKYQPSNAVLVVVSPLDMFTLERSVAPFSNTLSRIKLPSSSTPISTYPGGFLQGNRLKHVVLSRKQGTDTYEKLSIHWALELEYSNTKPYGKESVTATQIAFILSQIIGRRGPGSLYQYLRRRDWIPAGITNVPRISVPVDVSNFQILCLDMTLTEEGFLNRAAVVSTVYECIESLRRNGSFQLPRELLAQYVSIAKLQGYLLAPRPSDAIELAMDIQLYGLGENRPGNGDWYLFPEPNDNAAMYILQKSLARTLEDTISDPSQALIIATAGPKALTKERQAKSTSDAAYEWKTEPISAARFFFDNMLPLNMRLETAVLTKVVAEDELAPTFTNPLVPTSIRPPRPNIDDTSTITASENGRSFRVLKARPEENDSWTVLDALQGQPQLPVPRGPPEPSSRCAFVLELLSPRPARATTRQAAQGELWKLSFENAISDLAELGAPGGLAYEMSYNKYGLRISFIGISQNLPSYARRLCRRLVEHQFNLLEGPEFFPRALTATAVANAQRAPGLSPDRKRRIVSSLRRSTAYAAAAEGTALLRSCTGAVCFSQGDLTRRETAELRRDLKEIFSTVTGSERRQPQSAIPRIDDLVYKPRFLPRFGSPCTLPGIPLISDACGRVPR